MTNNGGQAFPKSGGPGWVPQDGMTLRDYLAAHIIPSVYNEYWRCIRAGECSPEADWKRGIAGDAYAIADAMIQAREKGGTQ